MPVIQILNTVAPHYSPPRPPPAPPPAQVAGSKGAAVTLGKQFISTPFVDPRTIHHMHSDIITTFLKLSKFTYGLFVFAM